MLALVPTLSIELRLRSDQIRLGSGPSLSPHHPFSLKALRVLFVCHMPWPVGWGCAALAGARLRGRVRGCFQRPRSRPSRPAGCQPRRTPHESPLCAVMFLLPSVRCLFPTFSRISAPTTVPTRKPHHSRHTLSLHGVMHLNLRTSAPPRKFREGLAKKVCVGRVPSYRLFRAPLRLLSSRRAPEPQLARAGANSRPLPSAAGAHNTPACSIARLGHMNISPHQRVEPFGPILLLLNSLHGACCCEASPSSASACASRSS